MLTYTIHIPYILYYTTYIESCVRAIKNSLDDLPGLPRTQIGFITFDSSVHFYNLKSSLTAPQMLVVSDLQDIGKYIVDLFIVYVCIFMCIYVCMLVLCITCIFPA